MTQNRSTAVMQRCADRADVLNYFPTPPWATRALCEWLDVVTERPLHLLTVCEPACGEGHMARPLGEYFGAVHASDVADYGTPAQDAVCDFLLDWGGDHGPDWVITNPPFRAAEAFIRRGRQVAQRGVAMLVRSAFLEGQDRFASLFSVTPPTDILQFSERVPMVKGRLDRQASTATAYVWLVWRTGAFGEALGGAFGAGVGTQFHWIAPCRARLDRDSDWPVGLAAEGGLV